MKTEETNTGLKSSGSTISYWTDSVKSIKYSKLNTDLITDVVIVGGGISGVSIAYDLVMQGKKIVLIEDGYIGSGETGRTTAHLVTALDDRYYELERLFGEDGAKMAAQSHSAAIDHIEETIKRENIECDFERLSGYLFLHDSDKKDSLEKEFDAATKAGVHVEKLNNIPGMNEEGGCLSFHRQAQFHIMKYMKGMCESIVKYGGKIYTETHADKIDQIGRAHV